MMTWTRRTGNLSQVGVEGTCAYGAGLTRYLHEQNVEVHEVPRPDRRIRRQRGKSDPIDPEAAARAVQADKASGAPKLADGPIEAIRMLRVARLGAVKAKTAAIKELREQNSRLKRLLAEAELEKDAQREVINQPGSGHVDSRWGVASIRDHRIRARPHVGLESRRGGGH